MKRLFVSYLVLAAIACDTNLKPVDKGDLAERGPAIASTTTGGVTTTVIDGTAELGWIYMDVDTSTELSSTTPDASWDLAFQRFKIKVNGGSSGTGNVGVLPLPGADFAALTQAPADGYLTDTESAAADDMGVVAGLAFESGDGWYSYNVMTHVLTARPTVFVLRTTSSAYFKLQILSYYDAAGTPGYLKFEWAPISAPVTGPIVVDATSTTAWTYLSLLGGVISVSDPATSNAWDVAFQGAAVKTNGGTSGAGAGGARLAETGKTFDTITNAPTTGFASDVELPLPGPPGSGTFSGNGPLNNWFDYNMQTHVATPKDAVFLVRTATGQYGKLQIVGFTDNTYQLRFAPLLREVATDAIAVDASQGADAWTYVSLRDAAVVSGAGIETSTQWDVAFSGAMARTNSGTSGSGAGGAAMAGQTDFALVLNATADFTVDTMMPVPGPPGGPTVSQNPLLTAWYDYDMATHIATPKDKTYLVRTADGGFAKLKITMFTDNKYTLQTAYAGALRNDF